MLEALGNLFMVSNDPDVMMIVLVSIIFLLFIGIIVASMNRKSSEPFEHENEEHENEEHENEEHENEEHGHEEHGPEINAQQVADDLEVAVLNTRDFLESDNKNLDGKKVAEALESAVKNVIELHGRENLEQHLDAAMNKHDIPHSLIDPIVLGHSH